MNNYLFPTSDTVSRREKDKERIGEGNGRVKRKTFKENEGKNGQKVIWYGKWGYAERNKDVCKWLTEWYTAIERVRGRYRVI